MYASIFQFLWKWIWSLNIFLSTKFFVTFLVVKISPHYLMLAVEQKGQWLLVACGVVTCDLFIEKECGYTQSIPLSLPTLATQWLGPSRGKVVVVADWAVCLLNTKMSPSLHLMIRWCQSQVRDQVSVTTGHTDTSHISGHGIIFRLGHSHWCFLDNSFMK